MKMKVAKKRLIAAIQSHIEKDEKRFAKETAEYPALEKRARDKYISNVQTYLDSLNRGGEVLDSYDARTRFDKGLKWPSKPKPVERYPALLDKLELALDDILVVDDNSVYMRFLDGKCVCSK